MQHDEVLDRVNDLDEVVGVIRRSEAWANGVRWVRVVNAFVVNHQGQLWIPRRSAHKRMFPLCLDMSVGGHVESGESYEEAIVREAREELGLDLNEVPNREIAYLNPAQYGLSAWMNVWEIAYDQTPDFNVEDFVDSEWVYPKELLSRLEKGERAKGDLMQLVRIFYA